MAKSLKDRICQRISNHGPISTAEFMEMALYDADDGYYETSLQVVGNQGDFITSVSIGPFFGQLLCDAFVLWSQKASFQRFHWIESGAHTGQLAKDLLDHCQKAYPSVYQDLTFTIIEPSVNRQTAQQGVLSQHHGVVEWQPSWETITPSSVEGIIFSNELLDALPVEQLRWQQSDSSWRCQGVTYRDGSFQWCNLPDMPPDVQRLHSQTLPGDLTNLLPDGFRTEVGVAARQWWSQAAARLHHGYLMTLDYGFEAADFFAPHRHGGTLRAYSKHRQIQDILTNPGEQDITAHVNFTAIKEAGASAGLKTLQFESQEQFLMRVLRSLNSTQQRERLSSPKQRRQFQTLIHPDHFGRSFSVLVQGTSNIPAIDPR